VSCEEWSSRSLGELDFARLGRRMLLAFAVSSILAPFVLLATDLVIGRGTGVRPVGDFLAFSLSSGVVSASAWAWRPDNPRLPRSRPQDYSHQSFVGVEGRRESEWFDVGVAVLRLLSVLGLVGMYYIAGLRG